MTVIKDSPKEGQSDLYVKLKNYIPKQIISRKNKAKTWQYGYNEKYDFVNISKTGTVGDIININGLKIGLPIAPVECPVRHLDKSQQYWERHELPKPLSKIPSIFQWNARSADFKGTWVDYIEKEFDKREDGYWFMNKGLPTYITGSHYMYLQWTHIDVG